MKKNTKMLLLSCIGIVLVVLGHTRSTIGSFDGIFPYYSFHMALFIFISGYFYKCENEENILKKNGYFFKKVKKLVIPYFIWNLIYGILVNILRKFDVISYGSTINIQTFFVEPWKTRTSIYN